MEKLKFIDRILPYVDDAFDEFCDAMLGDQKLSMLFKNDVQIQNLMKMQKTYILKTLKMTKSELKSAYIKLGEYNYDIRIPYVDFIKGSQMFEKYFLLHTTKNKLSKEIMDDIFTYFEYMKSFTAKGYLNRMIQEDKKDIDNFFTYSDEKHNSVHSPIISDKIVWLKNLLKIIEFGGEIDIKENDSLLDKWLHELSFLSSEKKVFIDDLEKRIMINVQNLFYFLKKEDYLEILPLYSSLLSIYKLTLLLNNVLTVEVANKTIKNLRVDPLSQLLRKEGFAEFLKKEMSYAKRKENYTFCIAYLDLDDFKYVNDRFGHYSGDKVIEKLGKIIKKSIRGSDVAFRIGGDEFAIIFKDANRFQAKKVCQKVKAKFSSNEFIFNKNRVFSVGASIGIIEYNKELSIDYEAMIELVDKKLYEAKNSGKNKILF
ncbi:MAG: GGDEF domain-containing protein [Campylobacteraceae bacterium]|nr:GGDEF domain-containing protein [Campylobacteraceae bacterium]